MNWKFTTCVFVPCAGAAQGGVWVMDGPSEEHLRLGAPAGDDREVTSSTRHRPAAAPPAGEEWDCGTAEEPGGHQLSVFLYNCR